MIFRAYLAAHADVYQTPPAVTFSHVLILSRRRRDARRRACAGEPPCRHNIRKLGNRFWLNPVWNGTPSHSSSSCSGTASADRSRVSLGTLVWPRSLDARHSLCPSG